MKSFSNLYTALLVLLFIASFGLAGCDTDGPAEEAGENIDEAVEEVGDEVEQAADEVEEEVDG